MFSFRINTKMGALFAAFIAFLSLAASVACALPVTDADVVEVVPARLAAAPVTVPVREWTVMLFINTKNNLSESGVRDLNLAEHAAGGGVGFVAQLGTEQLDERILREYIKAVRSGVSSSEAQAIHKRYQDSGQYKVRRYILTHDRNLNKIASRAYGMKTGRDMGDWKSLSSFIRWAKKTSPARRYALILSSHGEAFHGVSKDAQFHSAILPQGLGRALRDNGGLDLLILEACLMASAESLYELRDSVKLVAASEDTVIDRTIYNYPAYDLLQRAPGTKPLTVAKTISGATIWTLIRLAESAAKEENEPAVGGQFSIIRPAGLNKLAKLLKKWTGAALTAAQTDMETAQALLFASSGTFRMEGGIQGGDNSDSAIADLPDFLAQASGRLRSCQSHTAQLLARQAAEISAYIAKKVVRSNESYGQHEMLIRTNGQAVSATYDYSRAGGLSIHLPPNSAYTDYEPARSEAETRAAYANLSFAQESGWLEFTEFLYRLRGEPRPIKYFISSEK